MAKYSVTTTLATTPTAGQVVINPSGQTVTANAAFTSGSTYNSANWTVVSGGGGGGGLSITDNGDGTATLTASGTSTITDNGDGTATIAA
jgi:hypothetical protein